MRNAPNIAQKKALFILVPLYVQATNSRERAVPCEEEKCPLDVSGHLPTVVEMRRLELLTPYMRSISAIR